MSITAHLRSKHVLASTPTLSSLWDRVTNQVWFLQTKKLRRKTLGLAIIWLDGLGYTTYLLCLMPLNQVMTWVQVVYTLASAYWLAKCVKIKRKET